MAQNASKGFTKAITITPSLTVTVSIAANFIFGFNLNESKKTVEQLERDVVAMTENYNLLQQQITLNPTFNFDNSAATAPEQITPPVIQEPAPAPPATAPESAPETSQANVWVDLETNQLVFSGISPVNIDPVKEEPNNEYSQRFDFLMVLTTTSTSHLTGQPSRGLLQKKGIAATLIRAS